HASRENEQPEKHTGSEFAERSFTASFGPYTMSAPREPARGLRRGRTDGEGPSSSSIGKIVWSGKDCRCGIDVADTRSPKWCGRTPRATSRTPPADPESNWS